MKGLKKGKVRYLVPALALSLVTVSGVGVYTLMENRDKADAAAAASAVAFDVANDTVTATGYTFYTTANASKKVPAANSWIKTNSGKVDVSNFAKATTLYFAKSTSPKLTDIVAVNIPAAPTLAKAVYTPDSTKDVADRFSFQTSVNFNVTTTDAKGNEKTALKAVKVDVPKERIQYRVNDSGTWTDFTDKTNGVVAKIDAITSEGATIYVRVKAGTSKVENADNVYTVSDGSTGASVLPTPALDTIKGATSIVSTNNVVRSGVSKTLKIAKRPAAPAVTIDYVNHCVTLKSTQQYAVTTSYAEPAAGTGKANNWTEVPKPETAKETATSWTNKIYFGTKGNVTAANTTWVIKNVGTSKTLDSHPTYVDVPVTPDFVGNASVQGSYGGSATLVIKAEEEKKGIAYQYAIVDLSSDDFKDLISYDATAKGMFDYTNTKVKWSNVSTDVTGTAKATLAWAKVQGKQVIVRKAAVAAANEFSSKVVIFDAPKGTNAAPAKLADTTPMNCWTKLAQKELAAAVKLDTTNGGISYTQAKTLCANAEAPSYDVSTKKITFNIVGCTKVPATPANIVVKNGALTYDATASGAVTAAVNTTNNVKVTIDTTKLVDPKSGASGVAEKDAVKLTIEVPEGYVTDAASTPNMKFTLTCAFDNKAPVIKTKAFNKKTNVLTITFDSPMVLDGTALKAKGEIASTTAGKFTFKDTATKKVVVLAAGTMTSPTVSSIAIPLSLGTASGAASKDKVTVTLPALTDIAGNVLAETSFEIDNPFYVAP